MEINIIIWILTSNIYAHSNQILYSQTVSLKQNFQENTYTV